MLSSEIWLVVSANEFCLALLCFAILKKIIEEINPQKMYSCMMHEFEYCICYFQHRT